MNFKPTIKSVQISVIVPVFNTPISYLEKCLNSIKYQNFKDFELIIVDGGSNKKIIQKLLFFCKENPNFYLIQTKQKGVSLQRNKGIQIAKGNYITFIDSDDYVCKTYLKNLFQETRKGFNVINANVINLQCINNQLNSCNFRFYNIENINKNNFFKYTIESVPLPNPIKLYKASLIKHKKFNTRLSLGEDAIFNYELFECSKKTIKYCVSSKAKYFYRFNYDDFIEKHLNNKLSFTIEYLIALCKKNGNDIYLSKYLANLYIEYYKYALLHHRFIPEYLKKYRITILELLKKILNIKQFILIKYPNFYLFLFKIKHLKH